MTRKHFIEIAKILKDNKANNHIIMDFVRYLRTENPNFKESTFIEASGGNNE
jgi:hypothetical protein